MGLRVVTGSRYRGGFIGDPVTEKSWLNEKVKGWTNSVEVLIGVARRYPQTTYACLQKSLHQEWDFSSASPKASGGDFHPVKEALQKYSPLALFWGATAKVPARGVTQLSVNQAGLEITNPTLYAS